MHIIIIKKFQKVEWENTVELLKFLQKVKVINIKVKIIILWIWKGHFSIRKGHFCILWQNVGPMAPLAPPGSYVPDFMPRKITFRDSSFYNAILNYNQTIDIIVNMLCNCHREL